MNDEVSTTLRDPWNQDIHFKGGSGILMESLYQRFKLRLMDELVAAHTSASAFYVDNQQLSGAPLIERKFVEPKRVRKVK